MFSEMNRVEDVRSQFERLSHSLDDELQRNAARKETALTNELITVGTAFAHTAVDYAYTLNIVDARKNHQLLLAVSLR